MTMTPEGAKVGQRTAWALRAAMIIAMLFLFVMLTSGLTCYALPEPWTPQ